MKLNKIEKLKLQKRPWQYYQEIASIDPSNITEVDRFYLKNFGIYNTKLRSEEFMLRLRIPGGRISKESFQAILDGARRYEASIILTARSQIELHRLRFEEALALHQEFLQRGITSFATLTDNFRNIVTDVKDGYGPIEVYPLVQKIDRFVTDLHYLGSIPRKFNTAIVGVERSSESFFTNDAFFALAKKEDRWGFNLYLGGKNSHFAQDADIFVMPQELPEFFAALAKTYEKYGLRQSRTKARLWHLIEEIGMDGFKERLREFYPKGWERKGIYAIQKASPEAIEPLGDGLFCYRYETRFGQVAIDEIARLLENECAIRLGVDQNLYLFCQERPNFEPTKPKQILVCAGERYCIFSLFDTKEKALELPLERIEKLGIRIGYSGCLKGCGRHIASDIGLVGIRTNIFGAVERGVRLYLGGLYSYGDMPARLIFWAVPLRRLSALLNVIFDLFEESGYDEFEAFSASLSRLSERQIAYWLLKRVLGQTLSAHSLPPHIEDETMRELERAAFS